MGWGDTGVTEAVQKTVRKRDSAGTRARILNVATREFANRGYEGARTDDIADRARINKRMIYEYFGCKVDLSDKDIRGSRFEIRQLVRVVGGRCLSSHRSPSLDVVQAPFVSFDNAA